MGRSDLLQLLQDAFPRREFSGNPALHECPRCSELRKLLSGVTWAEISPQVLEEHDDELPLLTHEAYLLFLPAWLRAAILSPGGAVAQMLMVNLRDEKNALGFSPAQAHAIIQTAQYIAANDGFGPEDPVNRESVSEIERVWKNRAV